MKKTVLLRILYILGSLYRSNAKTQMDLIYFNYLPHLLHGCSRTLHFALLKLGLPKLLLFLSSNRKQRRKCCSSRNFINSNIIDSNQGKTRKQEEKGSFWTKGKDTRRTSVGKQLKYKQLADPHFRISACRHSHRAEFYFRNFSRRIQRCCGD